MLTKTSPAPTALLALAACSGSSAVTYRTRTLVSEVFLMGSVADGCEKTVRRANWLRRRSQKDRFSWVRLSRLTKMYWPTLAVWQRRLTLRYPAVESPQKRPPRIVRDGLGFLTCHDDAYDRNANGSDYFRSRLTNSHMCSAPPYPSLGERCHMLLTVAWPSGAYHSISTSSCAVSQLPLVRTTL